MTTVADDIPEPDETFTVRFSTPTNATISDSDAIGTIENDDTPVFTITDASIEEGDTGMKNLAFTVTLSSGASETETVKVRTVDGTATAGVDFTARTSLDDPLTFTSGTKSQVVDIPILGDINYERAETFTVELFENSAGTEIYTSTATGTIENNDAAVPEVSIYAGSAINEGQVANFNFSVVPPSETAIPIRIQFTDNGAGFLEMNEKIITISETSGRIITERTALNIATANDGEVTATILEDTETPHRYIPAVANSDSVTVRDISSLLRYASIDDTIETTGVTRGHNFEITASLSDMFTREVLVGYTIENEGDKAPPVLSATGFISVPANQLTGTKLIEVDQNYTASIPADATYKITINSTETILDIHPQENEITIPVYENDTPTAARPLVSIAAVSSTDIFAGNPVSL